MSVEKAGANSNKQNYRKFQMLLDMQMVLQTNLVN